MIIPGRISVAEIIDSPGFHSFRSGAPDTWRSVPTFAGPIGGRRSLTQPSPKRQAARAHRPGPRKSGDKDPLQRFVMMKCDLRFEAYAVSFLFVSKGCSSPTVVTVMRAGSMPSLTMWSNVALERFLPSTRLYLLVPRMSQ